MVLYRCAIDLEIHGRARRDLLEALEAVPDLGLRRHLGAEALRQAVLAGRLRVHYLRDEPWVEFDTDIASLSRALPAGLVRGVRLEELQDDEGRTVQVTAEKIVGRRGEIVRLPLLAVPGPAGVVVDVEREDLEQLRARWAAYPRWAQDALRRKHPVTRAW